MSEPPANALRVLYDSNTDTFIVKNDDFKEQSELNDFDNYPPSPASTLSNDGAVDLASVEVEVSSDSTDDKTYDDNSSKHPPTPDDQAILRSALPPGAPKAQRHRCYSMRSFSGLCNKHARARRAIVYDQDSNSEDEDENPLPDKVKSIMQSLKLGGKKESPAKRAMILFLLEADKGQTPLTFSADGRIFWNGKYIPGANLTSILLSIFSVNSKTPVVGLGEVFIVIISLY